MSAGRFFALVWAWIVEREPAIIDDVTDDDEHMRGELKTWDRY